MTDLDQTDAVETLAMECLERLPTEGDAVVAEVCSDHPELADQVRAVLRQLTKIGLAETAAEGEREFGDFRLLRKLGHGGMGVVWLAEQRSLHRRVALKLLHPGFQEDARVRERFRREVQALSMLEHPNICTVYEAGEVEHTPYLAMRYIEGRSLAAALTQQRLLWPTNGTTPGTTSGTTSRSMPTRHVVECVHRIEKVARALHAAHEAGVVHRDVKPGNILLDKDGEPVIVDFGLAHADDPALSVLTLSGEPLGTPAYMAPEQVAGKGGIDRRTDVYALGALLYECVTLHAPFEAQSRDSLYQSVLHDPVRDPRMFNRAVSGELKAVLEKALEKSRRRRFATALEFAEELRRIRMHEPIRTRAAGPLLRTTRWCQRNRAATTVIAVVTASLLVVASLLQRSMAAETGFRALALLAAAEQVEQENPELAFKLCREALLLQGDPADVDPLVIARTQQAMFRLGNDGEIHKRENGRLEWVELSADGAFAVVTGLGAAPSVHRLDNAEPQLLGELPHFTHLQMPPLAFAPRGSELAVGDAEGRVHLYDLQRSWQQAFAVLATDGDQRLVTRVAWAPDGEHLVAAYEDGAAAVWTRDGVLLRDLPPAHAAVADEGKRWRTAAFLPDGRVVAAGAIWNRAFDAPQVLAAADGSVQTGVRLIVCSDRRLVTFRNESPGARLWNREGQLLWESVISRDQADLVMDVRFHPDGERLAVAYGSGRVDLLAAADAELLAQYWNDGGGIVRMTFSPDGERLMWTDISNTVEVVELRRNLRQALTGHLGMVFAARFTRDGRRAVTASWDGTARLWELERSKPGIPALRCGGSPTLDVSDAGVVVATGAGEVLLCGRDAEVLRPPEPIGKHWAFVRANPRGTEAVVTCFDGSLWRWDLAADGPPARLEVNMPRTAFDLGFLADGSILVQTFDPPAAFVVEQSVARRVLSGIEVNRIAVDARGVRVLVGDLAGRWHLLERRDGDFVGVSWGDTETGQYAIGLALSPDGRRALVGTYTGEVQLWQLEPPERLWSRRDHQQPVISLAFAPDGRRAASGSSDGTVRVFDPDAPDEALVLGTRDHSGVWSLAFSGPDRLVTGTVDGVVRWWSLDAASLREVVAKVAVGRLTNDERARFPRILDR